METRAGAVSESIQQKALRRVTKLREIALEKATPGKWELEGATVYGGINQIVQARLQDARAIALGHNSMKALLDVAERDCQWLDLFAHEKEWSGAAEGIRASLTAFLADTDGLVEP